MCAPLLVGAPDRRRACHLDVSPFRLSRKHLDAPPYKRGEERLDTNDTFVCHFRDGKISEMWFGSDDPCAVDEFLG
jgi:hypothetical protein